MRVLEFINDCIVSKFEAFAHSMERTFGIPVRAWERACLAFAFAYLAGSTAWPTKGLAICFKFIVSLHFLSRLFENINRPRSNISNTVAMNPNRRDLSRLLGLFIMALVFWQDVHNLDLWFEFSQLSYWFSACNDLPPGASRVRKLLDSIQASFAKLTPVRNPS